MTLATGADYYARMAGWKIIPCWGIVNGVCECGDPSFHKAPKDYGKHPKITAWEKVATADASVVDTWWESWPESNIGVFCRGSGFIVVDVDPRNGGLESWDTLESITEGALPDTVEAMTGEYTGRGRVSRGRHLFYGVQDGESLKGAVEGLKGIDIKHNGYVLIAPSRHASGVTYQWREGHEPWAIPMAPAPEELLRLIRKRGRAKDGSGDTFGVMEWGGEKLNIDAMVADGIPDGERATTMFKIACAVANRIDYKTLKTEMGRQMVRFTMKRVNDLACHPPMQWGEGGADDFSGQCENAIDFVLEHPKPSVLLAEELETYKDSVKEFVSRKVETEAGEGAPPAPRGPSTLDREELGLPADVDDPRRQAVAGEESGILKRSPSDIGNGRRLGDFYGKTTKYTVGVGWHCWDGQYWAPDVGKIEIRERAKRLYPIIIREAATYADEERGQKLAEYGMRCKSNNAVMNAITSGESDPRMHLPLDTWNANDHMLGVRNGVVDLRTGRLISGDPSLHITKRCAVAYTPGMTNVRFQEFLDFATGGDVEFQRWLQRAAGLTISGCRQDVLFMVWGPAGSGKNTLVEALFLLLDSYSASIEADLLMARRAANSTDMYMYAELLGKRMMWVDELPEAERMKDDKVKKLTGSETIDGRSPNEKPFTFKSKGKLWISTNHKPPIRDQAMWRRIRPIPLMHVPSRPDPSLKPYIFDPEGALPAVLSWAVDGAVAYFGSPHMDPLGWCTAVWNDAEMYRAEENTMQLFLDEETRVEEGATLPVHSLFQVYRMWSEDRGEHPMSVRSFGRGLKEVAEKVDGVGKRALVLDRRLLPKVVESGTPWDALVGSARSY